MKVYCRFAPPHAFVSTTDVDRDESDLQTSSWIAPTMVLLSLRKSGNEQQQTFTVTDPLSGSMASSTCQRVFIPRSMTASAVGTTSLNSSSGQEEDQQQKQQKGVFDEVVRPFLHDLIIGKRCMFLAYGQTATGKTYTMFGPGVDDNIYELQRRQRLASNKRAGLITREETCEEEEEEEEGMVPRFLRAIFDKSCIEVYGRSVDFVDLSCLEVYNECTTDLVALQFQQQLQQQQQRRKTHTSKKKNGKPSSPVLDDMESDNIRRAWMRYENGGLGGGSGMRKISYKSTEKSQVLRGAMRLRCASAVECWRLLCGVLALRHRSQTERNVRSSRSHLLLRLVLHSTDVTTGMVDPLGEAMFVDLAGSETYREYAWIGMGNSNSNNNNNNNNNINNSNNNSYNNLNSTSSNTSVVVEHDGAVASPLLPTSTVDVPLVASTFNATRRDGDGLTAAERNSLRIKEMRHINSSLLALRKVVRALRTTSLTTRVPFRDSALTTILEPFLVPDGSATVAWIVCCSSRQRDFHETVESLRLGAEASAIPAHVQLAPIVLPTSTINRNTSNINNNNIHINSVSGTNSSAEGFSGERALSSRGVYTQPVVSSSLLSSAAAVATNISGREISNEKRRGNTVSGAVIQRSGRNSNNSSIMNSSNHIPGTASHYMNDCSDADKSKEKENKNEEDVEVYKQYAWQLLEQCKTLCERYDECVEELARAKQIITTKDREIAELRKLLATAEVQKDPQQQAKQQQQQQQQNKNKNKNKEEEEIEEELSKEESNVISTAPTLLPSSHSVSPGEHSTPVPPAWLRKSAVRLNHNDISLALPHLSFTAEPTGETKVKEEKEKKEVKPVNMEGSVHKDAETSETHGDSNSNNNAVENDGYDKGAVDLIDSILHRYCVHHDPLQDMNDRSSNNNNNTIQNDTMKNIERTPAGVLESKGCDNISVFTTPAEALLDTKMSVCTDAFAGLKVNTRRERLVSFVSPSSHGAVPLLKLEEELHPPHIIPPPPMRSSLCTNVMPSLGEVLQNQRQKQKPLQKEEVTKTKDTEVPGKGNSLVADENIAAGILQQLISRSAAFTETVPE
ncbi:kinesin [Trypanosoma theileri]|uniref:Kinesin n=1 Tax=Trypanosoma theileri TaxID=67003 RepID=A0A1X0NNF8_9TRYP|nr:kinesin [Trypanosoma theileri]ORC86028.1 kinesin [Trypanosoma theileri]